MQTSADPLLQKLHHFAELNNWKAGVAGVVRETQQAAQAAAQQPKAVVDNIVYEGRRLVDSASRNVQQTAKSSRQTVDSMAKQVGTYRRFDMSPEALQGGGINHRGPRAPATATYVCFAVQARCLKGKGFRELCLICILRSFVACSKGVYDAFT